MSETLDQEVTNSYDKLKVNDLILRSLSVASGWAKFLAILGFISSGFVMLAGIYSIYQASNIPAGFGLAEGLILRGIIALILGGLSIIPAVFMLRFANYSSNAASNKLQGDLEEAVDNLKSYFKFLGIYQIIIVAIFVFAILMALA